MDDSTPKPQVEIEVETRYMPERSDPRERQWFFGYRIRIRNQSEQAVQLLHRHWVITDANGEVRHVSGPGVVGQQPVLSPGESFEYASGCPLETPFGSMVGKYDLITEDGVAFSAPIPAFALRLPQTMN